MRVLDEMDRLQALALREHGVRERLLATRKMRDPLHEFCVAARELGFDINEMDLVEAGEYSYAAMRRATNGGGENSEMLENWDDYYALFMSAIEVK